MCTHLNKIVTKSCSTSRIFSRINYQKSAKTVKASKDLKGITRFGKLFKQQAVKAALGNPCLSTVCWRMKSQWWQRKLFYSLKKYNFNLFRTPVHNEERTELRNSDRMCSSLVHTTVVWAARCQTVNQWGRPLPCKITFQQNFWRKF